MVALSNETFSVMGVRLDFVKEREKEKEAVTHLIFHIVEGDMKATKDR
jgi:ACT domain-containing protein